MSRLKTEEFNTPVGNNIQVKNILILKKNKLQTSDGRVIYGKDGKLMLTKTDGVVPSDGILPTITKIN